MEEIFLALRWFQGCIYCIFNNHLCSSEFQKLRRLFNSISVHGYSPGPRPSAELIVFFFFLRFYLLLKREEGREKERERNITVWEKHHHLPLPHTSPRGLACNPGMCSDWESNQKPFGLLDDTQPTAPHQSGLILIFQDSFGIRNFLKVFLISFSLPFLFQFSFWGNWSFPPVCFPMLLAFKNWISRIQIKSEPERL